MTRELTKTVALAGVEIDVLIEFTADYVDRGIGGYEYWGARGVHHDWGWEIDSVDSVVADCDVAEYVRRHCEWSDYLHANRKRLRKAIRRKLGQVNRALATVDPDTLADTHELTEACGNAPEPDPDYDRYDDLD